MPESGTLIEEFLVDNVEECVGILALQISGAPFYSEIDEYLNCSPRHYFSGLFPVGEGFKVTKIFFTYRLISQD